MPIYINGAASISPQKSLDFNDFLNGIIEYETEFLEYLRFDYEFFMQTSEAEKMNEIVKNGVVTSQIALNQAQVEMPDAVIVGTGLGNTVAGETALRLKCHNYNATFSNRGSSFETALLDGIMHINEGKKNILVSGADEMTEDFFKITQKSGIRKKKIIKNTELLKSETTGALYGESVSSFVISDEKKRQTLAELKDLKIFYKPKDIKEVFDRIQLMLQENELKIEDIDLVIFGHNGNSEQDKIYNTLQDVLFDETPQAYYKHLCGESHTANAFALWMASNIMKSGKYPDFIKINDENPEKFKNILIYNHYLNINHSLILLNK